MLEIAGDEHKAVVGLHAAVEQTAGDIREKQVLQRLTAGSPEQRYVAGPLHDERTGVLAGDKSGLLDTLEDHFACGFRYARPSVDGERDGARGYAHHLGDILDR